MELPQYLDDFDDPTEAPFVDCTLKKDTKAMRLPVEDETRISHPVMRRLPKKYTGPLIRSPDKMTFACLEDQLAYAIAFTAKKSKRTSSVKC